MMNKYEQGTILAWAIGIGVIVVAFLALLLASTIRNSTRLDLLEEQKQEQVIEN